MRNILIFLLGAICALTSCQNREKGEAVDQTIRLPLTFVEGFGPGGGGWGPLSEEHKKDDSSAKTWVKTYLPVKGIPESWRGVKKSMVWLNSSQLIYQNYKAGKISQEEFDGFLENPEWHINPEELSAEPIKCYVYVVSGKDKQGLTAVIIDTNNNLDFSDDEVFYPKAYAMDSTMTQYAEDEKHYVNYEVFQEGQVVSKRVPMLVRRTSFWPLAYSFPQYTTAKLKVKDQVHNIVLSGGGRPDYSSTSLVLVDENNSVLKGFSEPVREGDLLSVGGIFDKVKYRNLGVNICHEVLELAGEYVEKLGFGLQAGYTFRPFEAKLFDSEVPIASSDYKGKYLFVDFWGTWCKGCVLELPELQKIYEGVDKERVEFVSIAGVQSPVQLRKFLEKRPLAWPQIISDKDNKLVETYNITGYPTNVLVGPDGRVVARNLRGKALERKLAELARK
ncbi:TlpA family protein disulfide reductase [Persicitalea sp.]|uniref:TlpA family protein disulfide reductase n=1 Tax=Persicitalea sp. TaxID=3100273 RepID=UPI0035939F2C